MTDRASSRAGWVVALLALSGVSAACESSTTMHAQASSSAASGAGGTASSGGTGGSASSGGTGGSTTTSTTGASGSAACKPGDGPTLLASEKGGQRSLALDADFVYFAPYMSAGCDIESAIKRVSKAGGAVQTLWTTFQPLTAIAVDEQRVYWSDNPSSPCLGPSAEGFLLYSAPKAGGKPIAFPASGQSSTTYSMALDATRVYWVDHGAFDDTVRSAPKDGGTTAVIYTTGVEPTNLVVDETNIYVASSQGIFSSGKDPGSPPVLLVKPPPPIGGYIGLSVDAGNVFFGGYINCPGDDCFTGFVLSNPKNQPDKSTELSNQEHWQPIAVTVDETSVYWTQIKVGVGPPENGQIVRVAKDGSGKTKIAEAKFPSNIAVDDTCVYWVSEGDGSVWKAPK